MMNTIKLKDFRNWEKVVDYYYDNHHWTDSDTVPSGKGIIGWIEETYTGKVDPFNRSVVFKDPQLYTLFLLQWS